MADNYEFVEPTAAPTGTTLRTQRAVDVGENRLATAAVLFDSSGVEIDLATDTTLAPRIGATDEAAAGSDTATAGLNGLLKRALAHLTTIAGRLPALISNRVPVDGSGVTQPVSGPLTDAELRATPVPVTAALAAGSAHIGAVAGTTLTPSGVLTRPADTTAYAAGDAVTTATSAAAPLTVANAARIAGGSGVIIGGTLTKSATLTTNASFRVWLFREAPTAIPNDNAAWSVPVFAERGRLIGHATVDFAAGGIVGADGVRAALTLSRGSLAFDLVGTSIIAIIEARGAYTPGSAEQFALSLDILAD